MCFMAGIGYVETVAVNAYNTSSNTETRVYQSHHLFFAEPILPYIVQYQRHNLHRRASASIIVSERPSVRAGLKLRVLNHQGSSNFALVFTLPAYHRLRSCCDMSYLACLGNYPKSPPVGLKFAAPHPRVRNEV